MSLCHNPHSYDRTNQRNKHGFATPAATKERRALKKAARKFSRVCERLVIDQQLLDMVETDQDKAENLAKTAVEIRWHIDDLLEMYEQHETLPANIVWESQSLYQDFMEGVEFY